MFYLFLIDDRFQNYFKSNLELNHIGKSIPLLSKILKCPMDSLYKAFREKAIFTTAKFFGDERNYNGSIDDLDKSIVSFISGTKKGSFTDNLFKADNCKDALPIKRFMLNSGEAEVISKILTKEDGANILFYGKPGTGKTALARSLGKKLNKKVYFISEGDGEEVSERRRAIIGCANTVDPKESIIVVDESDRLLNSGCSYSRYGEINDKSWLNRYLEESKAKIIWITNDIEYVEKSTLRRFSYSIEFKALTNKERINVWDVQLKKNKISRIFTPEEIDSFSRKYRVNAGAISQAVKDIIKISTNKISNKEEMVFMLDKILTRHEFLLSGRKPKLSETAKNYSLEGLNSTDNLHEVALSLRSFYEYIDETENPDIRNMNLLIYGPPGTGKTEYVKYLSFKLKRELIVKRASDLLSPFIGMTEMYIREAFDEAERCSAILFIDEADSFFTSRSAAHRSWEITQTNELLTQMENFKGVLVCATNFKENLDEASIRRFNFKVGFDN